MWGVLLQQLVGACAELAHELSRASTAPGQHSVPVAGRPDDNGRVAVPPVWVPQQRAWQQVQHRGTQVEQSGSGMMQVN